MRLMIVFFIRKFNDVDHIVPIVYKLAEEEADSLVVLSLNPSYPIEEDYRLSFLAERFDVVVDHVYRFHAPTAVHRFLADMMCEPAARRAGEGRIRHLFRRAYRKYLFTWTYHRIVKRLVFADRWAQSFLAATDPDVLVFDWVKPYQWVAGTITKAARALDIPTVAVPHGMFIFTNELVTFRALETGRSVKYRESYSHYDYFVTQFPRHRDMVTRDGLAAEKVRVLGSARYCEEWQEVHESLSEDSKILSDVDSTGKLKVVYMDFPAHYRMKVDVIADSMRRLSSLDSIRLIIKPHTRSNLLSVAELKSAVHVADEVPSIDLCRWADVLIGTSSSILLEACLRNKLLLYPKYFHDNEVLFEEHGACWSVTDYEEMVDALGVLAEDPTHRPYSRESVENALTEMVYGGDRQRDVLREYMEFIISVGGKRERGVASQLESQGSHLAQP